MFIKFLLRVTVTLKQVSRLLSMTTFTGLAINLFLVQMYFQISIVASKNLLFSLELDFLDYLLLQNLKSLRKEMRLN